MLGCSIEKPSSYKETSESLDMEFMVVAARTPEPTPTPTPDPQKEAEKEKGIELDPGWELAGDLQIGRWGHTTTVLQNDTVLVVGGRKRLSFRGTTVQEGEILPLGSDEWIKTGTLNWERTFHTASLLLDGRVLVAGGTGRVVLAPGEETMWRGNKDLSSAEIYDPKADEWASSPDMIEKRQLAQAITLEDGRVMIIGGRSGLLTLATSEVYDPVTNNWNLLSPMLVSRKSHSAITLLDNRILVTGGTEEWAGGNLASAEIYDPLKDTWVMVSDMNRSRLGHKSTLLPDGRVLVTGGTIVGEEEFLGPETTAEIYDPFIDKWTLITTDLKPRKDHASVALPGGKVLLIGGGNSIGTPVMELELYNPYTNEWSVAGSLPEGRNLLTATILPDGSILIVGGGAVIGYIADFPNHTLRFRMLNH